MALTIAVAQCNPVAGDLAGNTRLIVDAARKAHAQGAQLLLLPDGAFTGVPLRDLARRPAFVQACEHQLQTLRVELASLEGLVVVNKKRGAAASWRCVVEKWLHRATGCRVASVTSMCMVCVSACLRRMSRTTRA